MLGLRKTKRFERISSLELPPGQWERTWTSLSRRDVLGRVALAAVAAVIVCVAIRGWEPPFVFRTGYTPPRDIVAAVAFSKPNPDATNEKKKRARDEARYVYVQDSQPLLQLQALLRNKLVELAAAGSFDKAEKVWSEFQPAPAERTARQSAKEQKAQAEQFRQFRSFFTPQEALDRRMKSVEDVLKPFEQQGLLEKLDSEGNQQEIIVYPAGRPEAREVRRVADVLLGDKTAIQDAMRKSAQLAPVADRLFAWLKPRLKPTLTVDDAATKQEVNSAVDAVKDVVVEYSPGQTLAKAGEPLEHLELLREAAKHEAASQEPGQLVARGLAVTGLVFVAFLLCGLHMRYRQRGPLASVTRLIVLMLMAVAAIAVAQRVGSNAWRGELVPVLLFGMTMAIVYRRELAMLLAGVVALVVTIALGQGLGGFLLLAGATSAAVLSLGRIRGRSKLINVGLFAGVVAALLRITLGVIDQQPLSLGLLADAARQGAWAVAAGFLMTGLLPVVESLFGILTDLSLLVLGDVAHPLLQELVRRAPSTYNHSITVGSIAEAAAESIGARGLLVRVGAYFHDIGKMLKPDYFVENQQGPNENRHETLLPAMSTLVIIAHIKDGADLARQYRLPQPIIDLIGQHHGTTRVEFFYGRATDQQQADPNGSEVDETMYRYPGPKPQTKEAAVLMLADAVESASRSLVDPAPARIESLVRELAEQRLHGGQFDESGLTLRELRTIEKSMIMSLASIYHGRIKYPEPSNGAAARERREKQKTA